MSGKITKNLVNKEILLNHLFSRYKLKLVGSIAKKGYSYNDIDILITLPQYPKAEEVFIEFDKDLKKEGWEYNFSDEKEDWGIFHNYQKKIGLNWVGLDIWVEEVCLIG